MPQHWDYKYMPLGLPRNAFLKQRQGSYEWWHITVVVAFVRQIQKDHEFKVSLSLCSGF